MTEDIRAVIQSMIDTEAAGWDAKDREPFLSMTHLKLAWPFAPTPDAHDPAE